MKIKIVNSALALGSIVIMLGCSGGNNGTPVASDALPSYVQDAINGPSSVLSQPMIDTLSYMGNEERLAYDVYNRLYAQWGTKQFTNIATKSEYKHITAVQQLVQKYKVDDNISFTNVDLPALGYMNTAISNMQAGSYDISAIQALYDTLITNGFTSEMEALHVGCEVEVVDVTDLDKDILLAQSINATDIVTVFNFLRDGSYNHYWAFDAALKNRGTVNGCCTWATLCHPEYPQK